MSLRFQRRIKIAPGLSVNLSKSGVGLSAGIKGATISAGQKGLHGNLGLSGTGLSYRTKLNKKDRSKQTSPASQLKDFLEAGNTIDVKVLVESSGDVIIRGADDSEFSEQELRVIRKYLGDTIRDALTAYCDEMNESLEALKSIHIGTLPAASEPSFEFRPFLIPKPIKPEPLKMGLLGLIWPPKKRHISELNASLAQEFSDAVNNWNKDKESHFISEEKRKKLETEDIFISQDALASVLEFYLGDIEWPLETLIDFDFGKDSSTVAIDIDLPSEDLFPETEYKVPSRQFKVNISKLSLTKKRAIYRDYVHGVALKIAGLVFNHLPPVNECTISAYTQGENEDFYLYSVVMKREEWEQIDFSSWSEKEPVTIFDQFRYVRNMTKTGIFKPIQPFTLDAL